MFPWSRIKKPEKFSEYLTNNPNKPIQDMDDATWNLIKDWFSNRRICVIDETIFRQYFVRNLNKNYPYYKQLLVWDPGFNEYDYLLENYNENATEARVHDQSSSTENSNGSVTYGHNVKSIDKFGEGNKTTTKSENENYRNITNINETESRDRTSNRAGTLSRTAPDSMSYKDSDFTHDNDDWENRDLKMSSLNRNGEAVPHEFSGFKAENIRRDFPDLHIKNPSAASDAMVINKNLNEARALTKDQGKTYDEGKSEIAYKRNGENSHETVNSGSDINSSFKNNSGSGDHWNSVRNINRGHSKEISEMLTKAARYIETTNAWQWLYEQLDTCFYGILDEEE